MGTSPRLAYTELEAGQSIPETTLNETTRRIEQMANIAIVKDKDLATPPGAPVSGDAYIVAGSPTGLWNGWANRIAYYRNSSWDPIIPIEGMFAYVQDENKLYLYGGASWAEYQPTAPTFNQAIDDLSDVNTGTPADGEALIWDDGAGEWIAAPLPGGGVGGTVPDGGTIGQVLRKVSSVDQDVAWSGPLAADASNSASTATTSEETLKTYTLPANTLIDNQYLRITASGTLAATTRSRQVKLEIGGVSILLASSTSNTAIVWRLESTLARRNSTTGVVNAVLAIAIGDGALATQNFDSTTFATDFTASQDIKIKSTVGVGATAGDVNCHSFLVTRA